jgi:hypothetical protein
MGRHLQPRVVAEREANEAPDSLVTTTMQYVDVDTEQKRDAIARVFGVRASQLQANSAKAP